MNRLRRATGKRRLLIWLIPAACVAAAATVACAQPDKDMDPSVAAARTRQQLIKSVNIEFKRTDVEAVGSRSASLPVALKGKSAVPGRETTTDSLNRVILDGEKMRFENNHPMWHLAAGTLHKTASVAVSGGEVAITFRPQGVLGNEGPLGKIHGGGIREDLNEPILSPILFNFRGVHRVICPYPITAMKPTGVSLPIDHRVCKEYVLNLGDLVVSLWFDPTRDYTLRRLTEQKKNKLVHQLDVQYRSDDKWGFLPVTWTMHDYGNGGDLLRTTRVEVLDTRVCEFQPAETFEIHFPPGTWVYDARENKEYMVQSGGNMRQISSAGEEVGGSVPQPGNSFFQRHNWVFLCMLLVAVASAILILFVARKKRLRTPR